MKNIALLTVALSCALVTAAHADDYSVVGSGCQVDPSSVPYRVYPTGLWFAPGATGQITAWCPIDHPIDPPTKVEVQATDTASGLNGYVQVLYYSMSASDGSTTTYIGGVTSGTNTDGKPHYYTNFFTDPHGPNLHYFVRVNLYRNNSNQTVRFHGVSVY